MNTEVNLFTGGKGGVGKTLVALCAAAHFLKVGVRVLVVDLNIFNPDLYFILRRLADAKTLQDLTAENLNHFREDGFLLIPIAEGNGLLVVPDFSAVQHYQLPGASASFYNDYLNKVFGLPAVQDHNPHVCLVDTGFHIANLAPPGDPIGEESWLGRDANGQMRPNFLKNNILNVWFVWTLAALTRRTEMVAIKRTVAQLDQIGIGQFNEIDGLRHVLNPFFLYGPSLLESLFRARDRFDKMILDEDHGPPIPLSLIGGRVSSAIEEHRNRGPMRSASYFRIVANTIWKFNNGKRPRNFFPLLTYPHIKNYQSHLTSDEPISLPSLIDFLGEPYRLIEKYLRPYYVWSV